MAGIAQYSSVAAFALWSLQKRMTIKVMQRQCERLIYINLLLE